MDKEERARLKAQLVEKGLWNVDEPGDPTEDWPAVDTLTDRMQGMLAPSACLTLHPSLNQKTDCELGVSDGESEVTLASGESFYGVICYAALSLASFLAENPEWSSTIF